MDDFDNLSTGVGSREEKSSSSLHHVTPGDRSLLSFNGRDYYTTAEVLGEIGITRQTLWRWRHDGHVPMGTRYRESQVVFTLEELQLIKDYSNRMQPIEAVRSHQ